MSGAVQKFRREMDAQGQVWDWRGWIRENEGVEPVGTGG